MSPVMYSGADRQMKIDSTCPSQAHNGETQTGYPSVSLGAQVPCSDLSGLGWKMGACEVQTGGKLQLTGPSPYQGVLSQSGGGPFCSGPHRRGTPSPSPLCLCVPGKAGFSELGACLCGRKCGEIL